MEERKWKQGFFYTPLKKAFKLSEGSKKKKLI